jgi:predicted phosphodiesterase
LVWAVISDIHGNYEALKAIRPYLHAADIIYCLGDVVGYGPQPNECCRVIKDLNAEIVSGNHDLAAVENYDNERFNERARAAIEWTAENLTGQSRRFLKSLDRYIITDKATFVHGSWPDPDAYVFNINDAAVAMENQPTELCFAGHTHRPALYMNSENGRIDKLPVRTDMAYKLIPGHKYFINPGSIGQPRDGNPAAALVLYDDETQTLSFVRQTYDVQAVQAMMKSYSLPQKLIERLAQGL